MATLNVSDKQKQRVVTNLEKLRQQIPKDLPLSQATIVDMGMTALEKQYNLNTK